MVGITKLFKICFYNCLALIFNNLLITELEWMLGKEGAVPTEIEEDPKPKVRDVLFSSLNAKVDKKEDSDDDCNDW